MQPGLRTDGFPFAWLPVPLVALVASRGKPAAHANHCFWQPQFIANGGPTVVHYMCFK